MLGEALRGLDDVDLNARDETLQDSASFLALRADLLTEAGADAADSL